MLRIGLAKMIGCGWLHPFLGGLEFWNKFPTKYQTVRNYERARVIISLNYYELCLISYFFFFRKFILFRFPTSFQNKATPKKAVVSSARGKKRTQSKGDNAPPPKKRTKRQSSPPRSPQQSLPQSPPLPQSTPKSPTRSTVHDVELQEVEDAIEDEILPATQLPPPLSKRNAGKRRSASRNSSAARRNGRAADSGASVQKPPQTLVNMTQKRKENITSSFMASLSNKGISEELKKTNR